ncbi:hypothetical protein EJB05_07296 [Eragrostis curvula]|uniref:FAR1 domain-containing protein n=1 Tax=Eragrostis curvula TaxID=38414 RepID=A0A5J9WHC7_9POAL|nr:hypothetical protein EJB05_07296 [Eragrostis curvula]
MEISLMHDHEKEKIIGLEVDTELTPYEGKEFESEDAARNFYSTYARSAGFQIRISRCTRSRRDNSIISRRIVCSKEGFCESRPCDGFSSDQKQHERAGTRVGCKAMIMIKKFSPGKWIVTKFVKVHNHGPVPPRKLDARPAHQEGDPMEMPNSFEVDSAEEPFEGMEFESEEAAKLFYVNYARLNGFRARISRYCRSRRDNSIISRQIVCSKEGFREVRTKKVMTDEGKTKRPRMITRVGCKAMIVVKKMNSGKWMVSKFEKEHNHSLSHSKAAPSISSTTAGVVDHFAARSTDPKEVKTEEYNVGTHCNSTESLTVLYNNLCQEAIKFAKEGSVTEEVYHVAVSALKEAAERVAEVKRSRPTLPYHGSISERKHEVLQMKPSSAFQSSNDVELKITAPGPKHIQEASSNLVLIPTNLLTNSRLSNCIDKVPQSREVLKNGGQRRNEPESSYLHFENLKEASSQKPQNTNSVQALHGKDKGVLGSSEETMVAIPAIPLALCMPVSRNLHGASADGPYSLLAAPIEAVPISYRPAEPIRQPQRSFCDIGPFAGVLSDLNNKRKGPNPLVHATALACGARIVPFEEAASIVKAVESRIRSGGAIISKLPSSNLTSLVPPVTMPSSSEDEENDHSEPLIVDVERSCHDQSSDEMKLQSEPSEFETEAHSKFVQSEK